MTTRWHDHFKCFLKYVYAKLEQLERLRSEDTPRRLMITHTIESWWIPSQNTVELPWIYIGQGQRSSHVTHLLMLVIICIKYGKNPSRTIDATEWTRFSRSRPNDLESIGQSQRSLHATHPLMLMMICAKYGKNTSRIVIFFQGESRKIWKICEKLKFLNFVINLTRDTPSNGSDYLRQIWK